MNPNFVDGLEDNVFSAGVNFHFTNGLLAASY